MAAMSVLVSNMSDPLLKPRMLLTLLQEHVPNEKKPFRNPSELLNVVSTIRTHDLLSECPVESADQKKVLKLKAVDSWVERLLLLISSNMPDKCWAGISLIGVTCELCRSDRFLASYSIWFPKLLSHIQTPVDSHFIKLASCTSLSDLFTRLGGFSSEKKDATSLAGKVVLPVLKLLNEDSSEAVWEGAIHLLYTILVFFPSSVHRHYETAEAAIVSKIRSGKNCKTTLKKLAHCLSLLPKSKGDEDNWSLMMQKILLAINVHLNDTFDGFEEETKSKEAMRLLVSPGKEPPPPLGSHTIMGEALHNTSKKSELNAGSIVCTLMLCSSTMLTANYHIQVPVPVRSLLALVRRVLMVDGSVSKACLSCTTAPQQQAVCSQLPDMHMCSLDLLTAIIKGLRSQLLPHASEIVRLLIDYFGNCALPELRIKVYSVMKILLTSMGVGIAIYLAPELIKNASLDLNTTQHGTTEDPALAFLQPSSRKRKKSNAVKSREGKLEIIGLATGTHNWDPATPNSIKIAALEALEALLTVGGAVKSECWRPDIDLLLLTVATDACGGKWANEETDIFLPKELTSTQADFQLASLRALLASFLSRARLRPPYLAKGLALFHRGKQERGTRVAEFCSHALLALEVLIHPRARSLGDYGSDEVDQNSWQTYYSVAQEHVTVDSEPDEDELYRSWVEKGDESETQKGDSGDKDILLDHLAEKAVSVHHASDSMDMEKNKNIPFEPSAEKTVSVNPTSDEMDLVKLNLSSDSINLDRNKDEALTSASIANIEERVDEIMTDDQQPPQPRETAVDVKTGIELINVDSDSMDSFPDIIDADPDSDSDASSG